MEQNKKYFTGLTRDFGFCNVENGYIDENTGKLKIDPGTLLLLLFNFHDFSFSID